MLLKGHRFLRKVQTAARHILVEVFADVFASRWVRIDWLAGECTNLHRGVAQAVLGVSLNTVHSREHRGGLRA